MMTFKQLEAVYWVSQLGNFALAAHQLHTSQSAISKRIQELEVTLGLALFDRTQRQANLTERGQEVVLIAKQLLDGRSDALAKLMQPGEAPRRIKLGVTELTAMTWLPRLIQQIQDCYPGIAIEPDVDNSANLWDKVQRDELDVIFVPDAFETEKLIKKTVGRVENAWMCKPDLVPLKSRLRLQDVTAQRLIVQGQKSGTGLIYDSWLQRVGITPSGAIVVNNLFALIGLTLSGLGVSYLPRKCLQTMLDQGQLQILPIKPALPDVTYVALYKSDRRSTLLSSVVLMAQECCDFTTMFQAAKNRTGH